MPTETGWAITGAACFDEDGLAVALAYRIDCDGRWLSERARVTGWVGSGALDLTLRRQPDSSWQVNGHVDDRLTGLVDIDLGFTPASNTLALRRLALAEGAEAETTAVWLDATDWTAKPLRQTYRRRTPQTYDYHSFAHDFHAILQVDEFAAVTDYPELWRVAGVKDS
jgi:hypothetical protein